MFKITDYFYAFSKLLTSFILLGFLSVLGYALYISYKDVDEVTINLDQKFSNVTKEINLNSEKFLKIEEMINNNSQSLAEINKNVANSNSNSQIQKLQMENNELLKEIKIIKSQIKNILNANNDVANNSKEENDFNSNNIKELKDLIILKYENGEIVSNEIIRLESLANDTPSLIFEKLFLLEEKNFFGKEKLIKEFDLSVQKYVEKKFMEENNNSIIKFFLKYISIKPNDLDLYDSEDLNILLRAKNHLNSEEYSQSLKQVLFIKSSQEYFEKWISQVNLYIDFKKNIKKVN
tara:strand:- start:215 stop:1093 length:879 start_codon:yes stop_codon:yes gene_type:complete